MGWWTYGTPTGIDKTTALFLLVINVFMPGVGTFIAAFLGDEVLTPTIIVAVAQFFTSFIIVGFIWAIAWSVMLVKTAGRQGDYEPVPTGQVYQTAAEAEAAAQQA